jgi:hypothetical protein
MTNLFAEGATDPAAWGLFFGGLGPGGFALVCLGAIVFLVLAFVLCVVIALTGIPRFRVPGLAWVTAGVWRELHGLRGDLRAWQRGEELPDLDPLADSVPPPPASRAASVGAKAVRDEPRQSRPATKPRR